MPPIELDLPVPKPELDKWGGKLNAAILVLLQAVNDGLADITVADGHFFAVHRDGTQTDLGPLPVGPPGGVNKVAGLQGEPTAQQLVDAIATPLSAQIVSSLAPVGLGDRTGQATMARNLKAHIWFDYPQSICQRDGVDVTPSSVLSHNTAPGRPYFLLCPITINELADVSGGSVGTIGSGGALPSGWSLLNPNGVSVRVERVNPGPFETELVFTIAPGQSVGYATPSIAGADTGPRNVQGTFTVAATDLAYLQTEIGWVTGAAQERIDGSGGGGQLAWTISQSTASTDKVRFVWRNGHPTDEMTVRCHLRELAIYPPAVPSRRRRDLHPVVDASSYPAGDATVSVANGEYAVFAWMADRGVVPGRVTVTSGSFSLRAVVGNGQVDRVAVWKIADYVDGSVDLIEPPAMSPLLTPFDTGVLARTSELVPSLANMRMQSAGFPWSFGVASNRFMRSRAEVRPGDYVQIDTQAALVYSQAGQRRSEVFSNISQPYDTDVWVSFAFRTPTQFPNPNSYGLIWQWLDTSDPGDLLALQPCLNFQLRRNNEVAAYTLSTSEANPSVMPPLVKRWGGVLAPNTWHRIVTRTQFSRSGGGKLGVWVNSNPVYPFQDTPVGSNKINGPRPHYGFYGAQMDANAVVEHANVEFGTRDLSSRIDRPLPI